MANNQSIRLIKDGTSRAQRFLRALQPDFARIEERTVADWIRFAQAYAKELKYINENNESEGDWSDFLKGDPDEMAAYLKDPDEFVNQPDKLDWYSRPHFVLLLSFLDLLVNHVKNEVNQFTEKQLEYYFRKVLQFETKPALPDKVYLTAELTNNLKSKRYPLKKNEVMAYAGKDADGQDKLYQFDNDITLNYAQIEQVKNIFVDRSIRSIETLDFPRELMGLWELALGGFGENLTNCTLPELDVLGWNTCPDEIFLLNQIHTFLSFPNNELKFPDDESEKLSFANLRRLIRIKEQRDNDLNEWIEINELLMTMNPSVLLGGPRDFVGNFQKTCGINPTNADDFKDLQNVNNVYELYDEITFLQQKQQSGQLSDIERTRLLTMEEFVVALYVAPPPDPDNAVKAFLRMIRVRKNIRAEWQEMVDLLKNPGDLPEQFLEYPNFDELWELAFPGVIIENANDAIHHIDDYYDALIMLEDYFALPAEELFFILGKAKHGETNKRERKEINQLFHKARQNKARILGRRGLKDVRESSGFDALMKAALGQPLPGGNLPEFPEGIHSLEELYSAIFNTEINGDESSIETKEYIQNTLKLSIQDFRFIMEVHFDEEAEPEGEGAPPWKWLLTYRVLEKAERELRSLPLPEKLEFIKVEGIYANEDATLEASEPEVADNPRWTTFGKNSGNKPAAPGLAICSPLLDLSGGERIIDVDFFINPGDLNAEQLSLLEQLDGSIQPFLLELTGEKEWTSLPDDYILIYDNNTKCLSLLFTLPPDFDPVIPLPPDQSGYLGSHPALRLLLKDYEYYDLFSNLEIQSTDVKVTVNNLLPFALRNDDTVLEAGKPVLPFGNHPKPGSSFYFTHPEIAAKKLSSLTLEETWMGIPTAGWASHYENYGGDWVNGNFSGTIQFYDRGNLSPVEPNSIDLFNSNEINVFSCDFDDFPSDYQIIKGTITKEQVLGNDRYFILKLGDLDFGHDIYPSIAALKANELAVALAEYQNNPAGGAPSADEYVVNPPYTPQWQNFTFSYTAEVTGINEREAEDGTHLLHLHPFGFSPYNQIFLPSYPNEGELYIGISELDPPFELSLLFQMAEGSADPDLEPPEVQWAFLQGNEWKDFEDFGEIISDETNELLNSGVIKLKVPAEANADHSILPNGLYWLRISIAYNSLGINNIIGIHTQAVRATYLPSGNKAQPYQAPLPPETITKLWRPKPEIKALYQPYSSFGGRTEEPMEQLNTRISERLRHKDRALTTWDYERIVLEQFPQVYKVKCLPGENLEEDKLGQVVVIVVPDIKGLHPFDPFEPKLPISTLRAISLELEERTVPMASIKVRNPVYLPIQVEMSVELYPPYQSDESYYLNQLEEALMRYLAPWAYDEGVEISIGGKVYPSRIVHFVEQQAYVDYIKAFRLYYYDDEERRPVCNLEQGISTPRPDGIWVSARNHIINTKNWVFTGKGIGCMKIEQDFKIA